jgi:hypothetical protein
MTKLCNKPRYYLAALLAVGLIPTLWASSQVTYKWLDESGNVTYGDHPPMGVEAEEIHISTGTSSSSTGAASNTAPAATPAAAEPANTQAAPPSGLSPEKAKELCEQAKNNLEILQSHALIRQTDESGEVLILDEDQKQEQINTANTIIKDFCK